MSVLPVCAGRDEVTVSPAAAAGCSSGDAEDDAEELAALAGAAAVLEAGLAVVPVALLVAARRSRI